MGLGKTILAAGIVHAAVAQSNYSTRSFNYSATETYLPNNDYSNEQLAFLWNQVGPISSGPITTTVEPTPEPTAYPKPGFLHPLVPPYVPEIEDVQLPDDFLWGVSSSALQIEGAAQAEGRGPTSWDLIPHRWVNSILDNTTADTASNFYYLYKQDNARLKNMHVQTHAFSFAWSRFFPFGSGPVNEQGVAHYDDLFANMAENDVLAAVTLFHWDTPLALFNSYGAWTSERVVADFVHYAKFVIERYDKHVKAWFTFNEPQYCNWRFSDYPWGTIFPSYNGVGTGGPKARFLCGHYTLIAHAEVYHWYKNVFKGTKPMTMKTSANLMLPNSTSDADQEAVQRQYDYNMGWFGQCWREDGDYPESLRDTLRPFDLLPEFTQRQKDMLKGSCDFYAIDGYTTNYAAAPPNGISACTQNMTDPNYPECAPTSTYAPDGFPIGPHADAGAEWLWNTPAGLRRFLTVLTKEYFGDINHKGIMITEIGFADPAESSFTQLSQILWDLRRADYIQGYFDNILAARALDGVNVTGAFAWAIYDNYEWNSGMGTKFGLQYVNLTDFTRHPKASMFQFLNFFAKHGGRDGAGNLVPLADNNTVGAGNSTMRSRMRMF